MKATVKSGEMIRVITLTSENEAEEEILAIFGRKLRNRFLPGDVSFVPSLGTPGDESAHLDLNVF